MRGRHLSSRGERRANYIRKREALCWQTSRTRFKTRFQVKEGVALSPFLFFLSSLLFISEYCNPTITGYVNDTSLSLFLSVGASKRRVTAHCNNVIYGEPLLSWRISVFVQLRFKLFTEKVKWEFLLHLVSTCCLCWLYMVFNMMTFKFKKNLYRVQSEILCTKKIITSPIHDHVMSNRYFLILCIFKFDTIYFSLFTKIDEINNKYNKFFFFKMFV